MQTFAKLPKHNEKAITKAISMGVIKDLRLKGLPTFLVSISYPKTITTIHFIISVGNITRCIT